MGAGASTVGSAVVRPDAPCEPEFAPILTTQSALCPRATGLSRQQTGPQKAEPRGRHRLDRPSVHVPRSMTSGSKTNRPTAHDAVAHQGNRDVAVRRIVAAHRACSAMLRTKSANHGQTRSRTW
jgi:hypothetical protein